MKQYTSKEQTAKLIELGFPEPQSIESIDAEFDSAFDEHTIYNMCYSIGELIELLGKNLLAIGVTTILNLPIKHFVQFTKDCTKVGYIQVQGELIDKLFEVCVTLREEGVL